MSQVKILFFFINYHIDLIAHIIISTVNINKKGDRFE